MAGSLMKLLVLSLMLTHSLCIDLQKLFDSLTIEDKCGQMTQVEGHVFLVYPPPADARELINETRLIEIMRDKKVGSFLSPPYTTPTGQEWQDYMSRIHDIVMNKAKAKIPILYGFDSIHGAASINESVIFPQPIAMSATFNLEIARRIGEITALEMRSVGVPWNFNPVLDIGRQPLWPRLYETFGEDVHLATRVGEAYVNGHQGDNLKDRTHAAACLKHYIGYSFPFNGKDRTEAYISDIQLREYFLPTFEHAVKAGAHAVMINSGSVNGISGHANGYYINDILKGELGFKGFVVSDWQDIIRLHTRDKVAKTPEDAVRLAVMAGVDMSMVPLDFSFFDICVNVSKRDREFMERVNDATMRILKVKEAVGLFENLLPVKEDLQRIGSQESIDFNLEAARESIILAKNEGGILPLQQGSGQKILVAGATADKLGPLLGGWSYDWQGTDEDVMAAYGRKKSKLYDAIKKYAVNAKYSEGANYTDLTNLQDTLNLASQSDLIILCIGERSYAETQGNIDDLSLTKSQRDLADELFKLNKPIVVIYLGGRPRIITDIVNRAKALLIGFFPGERGAEAIADTLFGVSNPSARLPITYPKYTNGITTYDHTPLEQSEGNSYDPLFPFGHGLSYTRFNYSSLRLSTSELTAPANLNVQVDVANTGERDGKEVVMLYLNDEYGSVPRPVRQLKKFEKITLAKGEKKTISFTLTIDDLSFINPKSKRVYEPGKFNIYVSNLKESFTLKL